MKNVRKENAVQKITAASFAVFVTAGIVIMIRQALTLEAVSILNVCVIETILCLTAYCAWKSKNPLLFLFAAAGGAVLTGCTCFLGVTPIDKWYLLQTAAAITALVSSALVRRPEGMRPVLLLHAVPKAAGIAAVCLTAASLAFWGVNTVLARQAASGAAKSIWAVPSRFDCRPDSQEGTLETIRYETKAYATDLRTVTKSARVYLPFDCDPNTPYNILYLMHGTGDDETYWFEKNPYNKWMVDRLISEGEIAPLIIVTPTFYVEDDCAEDLDKLTYSFMEELRNDLMPAAESAYSTYAKQCGEAGFAASRDHRAFAGLSRGAVTALHSAFCGSLDYFSWFGAFSGSRTDASYLQETIQTEAFAGYPIHRFYASSGSFDFALSGQLADYRSMLLAEPRLADGVNASFDVYPMRYHSTGSWHLALYNFLPQIFTGTAK